MAFVEKNSETKSKTIGDDQSLTYRTAGTEKFKWMDMQYTWHGKKWEDFAKMIASSGLGQNVMTFFIGATIDPVKKEVHIRGCFRHEIWNAKYASRFPDWKFLQHKFKPVQIPSRNDNDELSFQVNGLSLSESWRDWEPEENEAA